MPTVTPSHVFADDQIPSAAEWNSNPNTFANALNGNLDSDNIDLTGAFAWTGAHTFGAAVSITGSGASSVTNTTAAGSGVVEGMVIATNPSSGTPADNDGVKITFKGDDDGGNATTFGEIQSVFTDVSDGSEDGSLVFRAMTAGSLATALTATGGGVTLPADLTVDTDTLYVDSTNNRVGIGTAAPSNPLHVSGAGGTVVKIENTTSAATGLSVYAERTGAAETIFNLTGYWTASGDDDPVAQMRFLTGADTTNTDDGEISFSTAAGVGGITEAMRIDNAGNVGIGTASPGATEADWTGKLHIEDATSPAIVLVDSSTTQENTFGTSGAGLIISSSGNATAANNYIAFRTEESNSSFSPTKRMQIQANGDVEIGVAAIGTTASAGFLNIPTCAGTPTGTPTPTTGLASVVYDSTNNKLYVYDGAWTAIN